MGKRLPLGGNWPLLPHREDLERRPISSFRRKRPAQRGGGRGGRDEDTLYWVSNDDEDWDNPLSWSLTSGGIGGAGVPTPADNVVIDGGGSAECHLNDSIEIKSFTISGGQFYDEGEEVKCVNLIVTSDENIVWDGEWVVSGTVITFGPDSDVEFDDEDFSMTTTGIPVITNEATNLGHMIHENNASYVTDTYIERMEILNSKTITFAGGITITLGDYQEGDWDGGTVTGAAEWYLDNSAPSASETMTVHDMTVLNSNATDVINALDNCTDSGGNTNWYFVSAPAATGVDLYWVSDTDTDWSNGLNWSLTSGGTGGAGYPGPTNDVYIDGEGTAVCTLTENSECANFNFIEVGYLVQGVFDQNTFDLDCVDFYYDNDKEAGGIFNDTHFDGPITVTGTFDIVTADYDKFAEEGAVITFPNPVTINSVIDLPTMVHEDDVTYPAAQEVERLILGPGVTATFEAGAVFRIRSYTAGDWDGATVQSDNPGTAWTLNNFNAGAGGMVVSDMTITDSTASPHEVDATDNCTDGGGNTNWNFGTVWKFNEATDKWNEANVKWNEAGA